MLVQVKRLAGQSLLYALGGLLVQGIGFLLLPVYTRYLSVGDYGIIGFANSVATALGLVMSWGFQSAVMRLYVDYETDEKSLKTFTSTVILFQLISSLIMALVLSIWGQFSGNVFRNIPYYPFILLAIWIAFLNSARTVPLSLFRIREQPVHYSTLQFATFAINSVVSLYLVVIRGLGAFGYLLGTFAGSSLMMVVHLAVIAREHLSWLFSAKALRKTLILSLPLIPNSALLWMLNLSDRLILERYVSLEQVGAYTLAYQFALVLQGIGFAADSAWRAFYFRSDDSETVSRVSTYYVGTFIFLAWGIATFAPELIVLATPTAYHAAVVLVPWVVAGAFAFVVYMIWADVVLFAGKTEVLLVIALASSLLNVGMNLYFIPRHGSMAAAVSTSASFTALAVLCFVAANRLGAFHIEVGRWMKLLFLGVVLGVLGNVMPFVIPVKLAMKGFLILLWPLGLFALRFWRPAERDFMRRVIVKLWNAGKQFVRI